MQNDYPSLFNSKPRSLKEVFREKAFFLKAYTRFHLTNLSGKRKILIYSMGKVGSSTLVKSFYQLNLNQRFSIYRVHYLSDEGINHLRVVNKKLTESLHDFPYDGRNQILLSRFLSNQISRSKSIDPKFKIITLIREPVALNISDYFQNYNYFIPKAKPDQDQNKYIEMLIEHFLKEYPHNLPLMWFDVELKKVFNIDVFSTSFPKSKGYKIYKQGLAEILIIKLEYLNQCAKQAFKEFLGVDDWRAVNANEAKNKNYKTVYKDFIEKVCIPKQYIDKMYQSQYAQHFYSKDEIDFFYGKWLKFKSREKTQT